jgi:hypothetical protein
MQGKFGGALYETPVRFCPTHTSSAEMRSGVSLGRGSLAWSSYLTHEAITLRGLGRLREDGLADEGENDSQPNN